MEDTKPFLSDKFCEEMMYYGNRFYEHKFAPIRSELELSEKNSKLVIIQFHLIKVRENLKANKFKNSCSLYDIENDLKGWLERYFKTTRFSEVTSVEYVNSLRPKQYEIKDETTILKVKSVDINLDGKLNFEFWRFNNFDQLQYYIGWCLLLLELNRLETECNENHININDDEFDEENHESKPEKLHVNQIALIHVYEGPEITKKNASEIAANNGYKSLNSGHGLYQDYTHFLNQRERIAEPSVFSKITMKNKIKLFESIIPYLKTPEGKIKVNKDIESLNAVYEKNFL